MKVIIINGPNLNLLGKRETSIYGKVSFDSYFKNLKNEFKSLNLTYFQSNIEGEIINKLHEIGFSYDKILLNAGGYTHTSVSISDAIAAIRTPVIEIHISIEGFPDLPLPDMACTKCKTRNVRIKSQLLMVYNDRRPLLH